MTVAADPNALHGLSKLQVEKAAGALLAHLRKNGKGGGGGGNESNDLFEDDDELLYMIVSLKKVPQEKRNDKPVRIAIPHPIYRFEGAEVCLIVKDAPGGSDGKTTASNKAAKAKARNQKLAEAAGVSKVIAVSKLKSKYEPHEAKRALANAFDLFLADARVLPSLARLLGKSFFRAKKQPVPVDLRGKDWRTPVADAVRATYYYRGGGSCVNVRVARSSFTVRQVTENVEAALRNLVPKLSATGAGGKWSGVRSVLLKSAASVALPVYQSGPRGVEEEEGDEEEEKEKVVVEKKKKAVKETAAAEKTTTTATKKKKASSALDEGAAKKKKKASSALDEGAAKKKKKTTARA